MSNEGRTCPQCSYQRQPKDLAPDYECPRCGIIYAKYKPPAPEPVPEESRPDAGTPEEDADEKPRPASLLIRILAEIYTGALVFLYFVPVKLFVYAGFRFAHPPESIQSLADIQKFHTWQIGYYIYLGLLIIYAFFIRPYLDGATWGQQKFGVVLRPEGDPEGSPTFKDHLLRFFGTARQYETGEPLKLRQALNKALMPVGFAIILQIAVVGPLSFWIMKGYLEPPRKQSVQKTAKQLNEEKVADVLQQQMQLMRSGQPGEPGAAPPQPDAQGGPAPETMSTPGPGTGGAAKISLRPRQAVGRQNNIRAILTTMEKRHMQDRGSYTEDLEALVANYSADPNERDELLKLVMQGALRARKTVAGVEIWQQNPSGEWIYEEVRR